MLKMKRKINKNASAQEGKAEAGCGKGRPFGAIDAGCPIFHQACSTDYQVYRGPKEARER